MEYGNQVEKLDCGVCVIQVLHNFYFKKWINLSLIKNEANYNKNGISIKEFENISSNFGIKTKVLKGDFKSFKKINFKKPFVTIIKNEGFLHYVIIEKITKKDNIIFFDPILGKRKIKIKEFENLYTGILIFCKKGNYISFEKKEKIDLFQIDLLKEKILIFIVSIIVIILTFIGSFYIKIIVDQIAPSRLESKLVFVTFLFIIINILKMVLSFSNNLLLNKIELQYQINLINQYIEKISRVQWIKIAHYDESMHLKNMDIILKISSFKTKYFFNITTQIFCIICSSVILIFLDGSIFLISFLSSLILVAISLTFQSKFKSIESESLLAGTNFKRKYLNIINGIEQYKLNSIKQNLNNKFTKQLETVVKINIKLTNWSSLYSLIINSLKSLIPYIIVIISINQIWKNNLTIGELFFYLSIYGFFASPFSSISSMLIDIPVIKQYQENINSFLLNDNEQDNKLNNKIKKINSIILEDIEFNYNGSSKTLKIKKLEINDKLILKGNNGSGKTTLLKIISTLITNQKVYYNNKLIDFYDLDSLREQICFISNTEYLPSGSIYDYLVNGNNNKREIFINNIEKYNLLDLFEKFNLDLHTTIEEGGKNFSSGQRQFVSIMRIFTNNYSLILFDEAFENIENNLNLEIFNKLRNYLKNEIVIEVSHQNNFLFNQGVINCEYFK